MLESLQITIKNQMSSYTILSSVNSRIRMYYPVDASTISTRYITSQTMHPVCTQEPILLTWIDFYLSMDK